MTNDPHPASAAWQDVEYCQMQRVGGQWERAYREHDVVKARAADAQQIADLKAKVAELEPATTIVAKQTFVKELLSGTGANGAWQDVQPISAKRTSGPVYLQSEADEAREADAQQIAALNARNQELEEVQEITAQETERLFAENTALRERAAGDEPTNDEYVVRLEGELEALREITEPWQAVHHLDPHQCLFGRFHPVEEVEKARQAERAQHQAALAQANQQIAALRAENAMLKYSRMTKLQRQELDTQKAQIEALLEERNQITQRAQEAEDAFVEAEAQLTALQAEQAQWQQLSVRWRDAALRMRILDGGLPGSGYDKLADGYDACADELLAALTAQQEKPQP